MVRRFENVHCCWGNHDANEHLMPKMTLYIGIYYFMLPRKLNRLNTVWTYCVYFNKSLWAQLLSSSCGLTISDNCCYIYKCVNSITHLDCGLDNFTELWSHFAIHCIVCTFGNTHRFMGSITIL